MNNGTKALFILGAIGGFIIAIMYIPGALGWTFADVPWDQLQWFLFCTLAFILVSIGFLGLWRKSGNVIPLVSAIFIFLEAITYYLLFYLWLVDPLSWPTPASLDTIVTIILGIAWLTAGVSAWILREEFSPFAIVATLVFVAFAAVYLVVGLLFPSMLAPIPNWMMWVFTVLSIVVGMYFLDAART